MRPGQTQYVWRAALASRLRVAHCRQRRRVAPTRYCVAHMRLAHTRHWRLWLARALAPCSPAAPRRAGSPLRLCQRASPASGGALRAALTLLRVSLGLAGLPAAALRARYGCARRGGAASAGRHWRPALQLAGCRSRAPRAAAASGGGSNSSFLPTGGGKKELLYVSRETTHRLRFESLQTRTNCV